MSKITDKVTELALPVVEEEGCSLWDVEYVREAGSWYLRVFIDKEGGVGIDDCERISRRLDPILDEADPIPDSYVFEVGSAGAERELKRPRDFEQFMGAQVELKSRRKGHALREGADRPCQAACFTIRRIQVGKSRMESQKMNADFFEAIEDIEKEKGIPRGYMYDKIKQAMLAAFRRDNPECEDNVEIILDEETKRMEMNVVKTVVEEVEDPSHEIQLEAAKKVSKRAKLGDELHVPVETKKFGRIAAQAAKQVIIQGIREAERGIIYEEFTSKEHEILTGVVSHIEPRNGSVSIRISSNSEFTEAMLAPNERIKTEALREGDRIKVYVVEVRNSTRGPQVLISRTHPGLVKRLFELEVPEIYDGTVEIKSIAREAGSRTKMAVWSSDPDVDPIGSCVGPKGGRVASIVNELGGEKIDIVKYSEIPEEYIAAALSPSEVLSVTMLEDGKSCRVVVPDSQLSLAIGKEGQNARLAAKLTGCKIDIKPESEG